MVAINLSEAIKNMLPQRPSLGPPLPAGLGILWPWVEEAPNGQPPDEEPSGIPPDLPLDQKKAVLQSWKQALEDAQWFTSMGDPEHLVMVDYYGTMSAKDALSFLPPLIKELEQEVPPEPPPPPPPPSKAKILGAKFFIDCNDEDEAVKFIGITWRNDSNKILTGYFWIKTFLQTREDVYELTSQGLPPGETGSLQFSPRGGGLWKWRWIQIALYDADTNEKLDAREIRPTDTGCI